MLWKTIVANMIMFAILCILKIFIPFDGLNRGLSLVMIIIYGFVGAFIYLIATIKLHVYDDIFSERLRKNIMSKLHIKG